MNANNTLAVINAQLEADASKESFRTHLGASVIGRPCAREVWYKFHWTNKEKFAGRMLRLFNRGHKEEDRFAGYLRSIGAEVWVTNPDDIDPETKLERQFRVSEVDGHFGGSLDGVVRGLPEFPNVPILCEFKTHNDKSFKKLVEDGLMKAKWEHFIQMQTYMHLKGLKLGLYMAVNKNDDDLFLTFVEPDPEQAERVIERARMIIYATEAPAKVNNSPGYWLCKFCSLNRICHFKDTSEVEQNCRTCVYSEPARDGSGNWVCNWSTGIGKDVVILDKAAQLAGCQHYTMNPALFAQP